VGGKIHADETLPELLFMAQSCHLWMQDGGLKRAQTCHPPPVYKPNLISTITDAKCVVVMNRFCTMVTEPVHQREISEKEARTLFAPVLIYQKCWTFWFPEQMLEG
jgi:hypothetical protein